MQGVDFRQLRIRSPARWDRWVSRVPALFLSLFFVNWLALWLGAWSPALRTASAYWGEALLVVLALATIAAGLTHELPPQNVFLACILLLLGCAGLFLLNLATGIPLGILVPEKLSGKQLLCILPITWTMELLTCRGVARLALRPFRKGPYYGYGVLASSTALALFFELGLQPYATTQELWAWTPTKVPAAWYGTPWVTFFGWAISALVLLICATPALINKSPGHRAPGYFPFWVWLLLKVLFASAAIANRLWVLTVLSACELIVVMALVIYSRHECGPTPGRSK